MLFDGHHRGLIKFHLFAEAQKPRFNNDHASASTHISCTGCLKKLNFIHYNYAKIWLDMGCVLAISKPLLYLPLHFDKILEDSIWRQVASVYIIIFLQTRTSLTTFIFFFHLSWKLSIFVMSLSQLEIPAQTFIIFIFSNIFLVLLMDSTIQILAAQS